MSGNSIWWILHCFAVWYDSNNESKCFTYSLQIEFRVCSFVWKRYFSVRFLNLECVQFINQYLFSESNEYKVGQKIEWKFIENDYQKGFTAIQNAFIGSLSPHIEMEADFVFAKSIEFLGQFSTKQIIQSNIRA